MLIALNLLDIKSEYGIFFNIEIKSGRSLITF